MLKQLFPYLIAIILSTGCFSHVFAQKKRVLVVPYTRFQFVSEFKLEEIAQQNNTSANNVFDLYQKELNDVFSSFQHEEIEFVYITANDYHKYRRFIKYNIDKFKGKKYNASNLSVFPTENYTDLLASNNAQYIVFINWYNIQKSVFTTYTGDRNKRNKYSSHSLDYDVYNKEKIKISGKGNVELNCGDFPSASMIAHKSLNAEELKLCYKVFLTALATELSSY